MSKLMLSREGHNVYVLLNRKTNLERLNGIIDELEVLGLVNEGDNTFAIIEPSMELFTFHLQNPLGYLIQPVKLNFRECYRFDIEENEDLSYSYWKLSNKEAKIVVEHILKVYSRYQNH